MKKIFFVLILSFTFFQALGQVAIGPKGGVVPLGSYPAYYNQYLKGGFKSGADVASRDAYPVNLRDTESFIFFTENDSKFWVLKGGTANSNWVELVIGGAAAGISRGSTYPASPSAGDLFYHTSDKRLYLWNGTVWVPTDNLPAEGDVLYNTTEKQLYVYNGSAWVAISGSSSPGGPANPPTTGAQAGDVFYNTTEKRLYVYDGSAWVPVGGGSTPTGPINPASGAAEGDVFYNTTEKQLYVFNGSAWVAISGSSSPGGPANPPTTGAQAGDVFYNTTEKRLYVYDGSAWVPVSDGSAPTGPNNPPAGDAKVGDVFYNTTEKKLYVYDGSAWVPVGDNLGSHTASANLEIGTYSISNDGDAGDGLTFDTDGNAYFGQDVTVNNNLMTPSDRRLKTNIETLSHVLESINGMRGVRFEYIDQKKYAKGPKIGVIAQELLQVYPSLVTKGKDGFYKVDYTQLTGILIQGVKELQVKIADQQKDIDFLKDQAVKQEKQIESILKKLNSKGE